MKATLSESGEKNTDEAEHVDDPVVVVESDEEDEKLAFRVGYCLNLTSLELSGGVSRTAGGVMMARVAPPNRGYEGDSSLFCCAISNTLSKVFKSMV